MVLKTDIVMSLSDMERVMDLRCAAQNTNPDEALKAKLELEQEAFSATTRGDLDKAAIYMTAAFKVGAITHKEFLNKVASYILSEIDNIKRQEDGIAVAQKKETDPNRLTLFGLFEPGLKIKELKDDPTHAELVIRENLQRAFREKEPSQELQPLPFNLHTFQPNIGLCGLTIENSL